MEIEKKTQVIILQDNTNIDTEILKKDIKNTR